MPSGCLEAGRRPVGGPVVDQPRLGAGRSAPQDAVPPWHRRVSPGDARALDGLGGLLCRPAMSDLLGHLSGSEMPGKATDSPRRARPAGQSEVEAGRGPGSPPPAPRERGAGVGISSLRAGRGRSSPGSAVSPPRPLSRADPGSCGAQCIAAALQSHPSRPSSAAL